MCSSITFNSTVSNLKDFIFYDSYVYCVVNGKATLIHGEKCCISLNIVSTIQYKYENNHTISESHSRKTNFCIDQSLQVYTYFGHILQQTSVFSVNA